MATVPTLGPNSGKPTLFRFWSGRSRRDVVSGHMVHGDEPFAAYLAEQPRVDALGDAGAALQPVLADQHCGLRIEHFDLHVVEVRVPAPLGRAAIVANVMVERTLPPILKLAARDEDHVR